MAKRKEIINVHMSHAGVLSSPARLTCKSERGDYIQNATLSNPSSQNSPSKGIFFTAKHVSLRDLFSSAGNQRCFYLFVWVHLI